MQLPEVERAALSQMLEAAPNLDRWRLRAQQVEVPQAGSELAMDDRIYLHMAVSQLVRMSLIPAGEHLRLALDAVRIKQVYPSSHFTVLRGALVGASQAVWMLGPVESTVRQERALILLTEMYNQMAKYYHYISNTDLDAEDRVRLADQKEWLSRRTKEVARLRSSNEELNLTRIIGVAANELFADNVRRQAVERLWKEMSADAHVLGWSLAQRATFGPPDRRTGIGEGRAGGSLKRIAEPFLASYRLLRHGWSLFDRRCEAPTIR